MKQAMQIRATHRGGLTEVRLRIRHDMENGRRRDADGALVPAWFITEVTAWLGERLVLAADFGPSVARDPYLVFRFHGGAPGEKLRVDWLDNRAGRGSGEAAIL